MVGSAGRCQPAAAARRSQGRRCARPAYDAAVHLRHRLARSAPPTAPPSAARVRGRWAMAENRAVLPPDGGQVAADDARPRPPHHAALAASHAVRRGSISISNEGHCIRHEGVSSGRSADGGQQRPDTAYRRSTGRTPHKPDEPDTRLELTRRQPQGRKGWLLGLSLSPSIDQSRPGPHPRAHCHFVLCPRTAAPVAQGTKLVVTKSG